TLDNSFLPRIWAMRKIGYLLESMRLNGTNQEIINEVVELATRHGIVTPYTSQLVLEPGMTPPVARPQFSRVGSGPPATKPLPAPEALREINNSQKAAVAAAPVVAQNARTIQSGESATGLANWEKQLQNVGSNAVSNTGKSYDFTKKEVEKDVTEF